MAAMRSNQTQGELASRRRDADIHSQIGSVKVPHGNPRRSNLKRTSKQIRLGKNILIISVSYDFGGTLSPNKLFFCHNCGSICN
jgi:hypothetical protein